MDYNKEYEKQLNNNMEITNNLLVDMVKNQKESYSNFVKVFIVVVICYTFILAVMICGYFYKESQFDTYTTYTSNEAETDEGGNAIINSGEMSYGTSEIGNSNEE